jgi:hypothetical protein
VATFGYHPNPPTGSYNFYGSNVNNTLVSRETMPGTGGLITSLQIYAAARNGAGNTTARFCVWDSGGNILAQSGDITLTPGSGGTSGQSYVSGTLGGGGLKVNGGTVIFIGMWRHASQSHEWTEDSNANTEYSSTDSNNVTPPSHSSFSSAGGHPGIQATYTPAPTLSSFNPTVGGIGTSVSIVGQFFTGATEVDFGGVASGSISVVDDQHITATVPSGAVTGVITVKTPAGNVNSSSNFTVSGGYVRRTGVWTPSSLAAVRRSSAWTTATFVGVRRSSAWVASG